jgi:uncharacterized protein YuzE
MESQRLKVTYYQAKDYLYLTILPPRPAVLEETGFEFYIRYDAHNPDEVVGFEWLGFAKHFPAVDEPGIIPELPLRFAIEGTEFTRLTLREVLRWVYEQYVLRWSAVEKSRLMPALAMKEKPDSEYEA